MNQRIIYSNLDGGVSVIIPANSIELALKDVPKGAAYEIVDAAEIPADRTFRAAWIMDNGCIEHDLSKCKAIAHEKRRIMRASELAPHDDIIAKQIPGHDATKAEAARQAIRSKYDAMQDAIDDAATPNELKELLGLE